MEENLSPFGKGLASVSGVFVVYCVLAAFGEGAFAVFVTLFVGSFAWCLIVRFLELMTGNNGEELDLRKAVDYDKEPPADPNKYIEMVRKDVRGKMLLLDPDLLPQSRVIGEDNRQLVEAAQASVAASDKPKRRNTEAKENSEWAEMTRIL